MLVVPSGRVRSPYVGVPHVDYPVGALGKQTSSTGRPFPDQGYMTPRQVLMPSFLLHTPLPECVQETFLPFHSTLHSAQGLGSPGGALEGPHQT